MRSPDPIGPAMPSLWPMTTDNLGFAVAGRSIIAGISLRLDADSFTMVMGANGAGKSLLLRLLHGLVAPTSGRIAWGGQPSSDAVRLRQAMVFQRPVLLRRSVAANIDWVLALRTSRTQRAVTRDALLERVGLLGRARQPARLLSGGQQQRLALARALVLKPDVLFLDEPTASLDPASTAQIEALVCEARAQGSRIIFITHDIGQARRLADDIVFMHGGRLVEHTPAHQFFDRPVSEPARAYLEGRLFL